MKKTKNFPPYTDKKCTLQKTGAGVYIISKNGKYLYIGYSSADLKKTMYRHFQSWNDPVQRRVTYSQLKDIVCLVIFCNTAKQASILEEALILKHKPRDNEQKLELYTNRQTSAALAEEVDCDFTVPF